MLSLIANGIPLIGLSPALAAGTPAATTIDNQASGTFQDAVDSSAGLESVVSNTVRVTVAEVAGITIVSKNTPTAATNAVANFDFTITNVGNDPTKFFLPTAPSSPIGGTAGTLQIVAYINPAGVEVPLTTPINITAAGDTGAVSDPTLGGNTTLGSIAAGAAIVVRVPVTVTAAAGSPVTVTLGNTSGQPSASNTPYVVGANGTGGNDVYTVDNADGAVTGEAAGSPINGDSTGHSQESSATQSVNAVTALSINISGTVFEDPNYGGGAGRPLATTGTSVRDGAIVELYDSAGNYVSSTTSSGGGKYSFTSGIVAGNYYVRVVNSTVSSSRTGYVNTLTPVQTFHTIATTGIAVDDPNRVGGEKPSVADTGAAATGAKLDTTNFTFTTGAGTASTNAQAESITPVTVGTGAVSGIDFGYNFDTIVNTNDSGQGSLRQFVTNSNALTNTTLAQVGQTAGQEVSIFMIPDGTAHPGLASTYATGLNGTGGNANAAVIALSTQLVITDKNTSIDARTQTTNVSNSNSGTVGTGGTVGVDGLTLDLIPKPEVVLDFSPMPLVNGNFNSSGGGSNAIVIDAQNTTLAGFAYYGYKITAGLGGFNKGMVWIKDTIPDAGKATMTQLFGGTLADGSSPPTNAYVGYAFQSSGATDIYNNYFAYLADAGNFTNTNGATVNFYNNEVAYNGPKNASTNDASGIYADQLETDDYVKNFNMYGNLIRNATHVATTSQGKGLQISKAASGNVRNNTFSKNYQAGIVSVGTDVKIEKNIIADTYLDSDGKNGSGIIIARYTADSGLRNTISQNSIYRSARLGIDLWENIPGTGLIAGVSGNDGLTNSNASGIQAANIGIDYPIITSSSISGGNLTVKGFVGTGAVANSIFAGATLEFFVADDDFNNNGEVMLNDGKSKSHGEGKTYIGGSTAGNLCITDSTGAFSCTFPTPSGFTDPKNITATATDATGNTSEFSSVPTISNPNVLLVKRITAINGGTSTLSGDSLAGYIDSPTNPYDDNTITITTQPTPTDPPKDTDKWPNLSTFMLGGIDGGNIKPNDELEYTIYFLSAGDGTANNVLFCDRVPSNVTFIPTAFNSVTAATSGLPGDRGILALLNGTTTSYTNIADGDAGRYFPPGSDPTAVYPNVNCGGANDNGAVVMNLGNVPNATAPGTPTSSFGFVRFKVRVK